MTKKGPVLNDFGRFNIGSTAVLIYSKSLTLMRQGQLPRAFRRDTKILSQTEYARECDGSWLPHKAFLKIVKMSVHKALCISVLGLSPSEKNVADIDQVRKCDNFAILSTFNWKIMQYFNTNRFINYFSIILRDGTPFAVLGWEKTGV
jgi:hypothetical protein